MFSFFLPKWLIIYKVTRSLVTVHLIIKPWLYKTGAKLKLGLWDKLFSYLLMADYIDINMELFRFSEGSVLLYLELRLPSALKKEMATHSSVLAWRIPGTGEPGGLLSMGSHRVGHDWSDLAAAVLLNNLFYSSSFGAILYYWMKHLGSIKLRRWAAAAKSLQRVQLCATA